MLVDSAIESFNRRKAFFVISYDPEHVCDYITHTLGRGATVWQAQGAVFGLSEVVIPEQFIFFYRRQTGDEAGYPPYVFRVVRISRHHRSPDGQRHAQIRYFLYVIQYQLIASPCDLLMPLGVDDLDVHEHGVYIFQRIFETGERCIAAAFNTDIYAVFPALSGYLFKICPMGQRFSSGKSHPSAFDVVKYLVFVYLFEQLIYGVIPAHGFFGLGIACLAAPLTLPGAK